MASGKSLLLSEREASKVLNSVAADVVAQNLDLSAAEVAAAKK